MKEVVWSQGSFIMHIYALKKAVFLTILK